MSKSDGLTEEEEALLRHIEETMEPRPGLLERYVHPITGEVINEGGPDTPEVRALREEGERWWIETLAKRREEAERKANPKRTDALEK